MSSSDQPYDSTGSAAAANANNAKNATSRRSNLCPAADYAYASTLPKYEGDPLENVYKRIKDYDKDMCDAWKDEIEKLLIFAGLFSATVTAFTIESYKWLKEDKTVASAMLLRQISLQLSAIASNNSTGALVMPSSPFTPDPRSVRINILWFISLVISLSAVFFGILCLQWLREFTRAKPVSPARAITIRQFGYDGLIEWGVPGIMMYLPILLQAAVLLFFAGILDLMWSLHHVVASFITALMAVVALMILFTTMAPFYDLSEGTKSICPYKSPLSWIFFPFAQLLWSSWSDVDLQIHDKHLINVGNEEKYNITGFARALQWMKNTMQLSQNAKLAQDLYHAFHEALPIAVSTPKISREIGETK